MLHALHMFMHYWPNPNQPTHAPSFLCLAVGPTQWIYGGINGGSGADGQRGMNACWYDMNII